MWGRSKSHVAVVYELLSPYGARAHVAAAESGSETETKLVRGAKLFVPGFLVCATVAGAAVSLLVVPWGGPVAVIVAIAGRRIIQIRFRERRRDSLDRDLPALLTSVASSVKAGLDPLAALVEARDYFPKATPLSDELECLRRGLSSGDDEVAIINRFLSGYGNQDGELFKRCLLLSRRHGASLAEPLHRITKVVRARHSFRRKVRAALVMHRMSAIGIAVCALIVGAIQAAMNMSGVVMALHHATGRIFIIVGASLIISGVCWMLSMGRGIGR